MKKIVYIIIIIGVFCFQGIPKKDKSMLNCELEIQPKIWMKNSSVEVTVSLENVSSSGVNIAKSIVGSDMVWFRIRIEDSKGNVIKSGLENVEVLINDLPALIIDTLESNEEIVAGNKCILDKGQGFNYCYDLIPGKYFISMVYRFAPGKETGGADYYLYESNTNNLWTGTIISNSVEIEILSKQNE